MSSTAAAASPALGVLLVDDNPGFRIAARAILAMSERFAVVGEAGSGEEAVAAARDLVPDVVLMDVRLPGIDGVEATRQVVAALPRVAVVLISTLHRHELPPGADSCGAVGYLRKEDVDPAALEALLA